MLYGTKSPFKESKNCLRASNQSSQTAHIGKLEKPAQGPCNLFLGVYSICYVKINGMTPDRKMGADAVGPQSCIQETLAGSIFTFKRV
jgi:hypothetical protein